MGRLNSSVLEAGEMLAEYGLYRVHWSQLILDETTRNLIKRRKMNDTQAAHLQEELAKAFPEAMVSVPDKLIAQMTNDQGDRHVSAMRRCCSSASDRDFQFGTLQTEGS